MFTQQSRSSLSSLSCVYSLRNMLALGGIITVWRLCTLVLYPLNLSFDEAQYWIWAQAPSWGYFSKPPMIAWVIFATTSLCGDTEPCIRLGSPVAYFIASLAIYIIGKRLYNIKVGFWSSLIFLTLPGVSFSSILISTDPFFLMFWSLGLVVFMRALSAGMLIWWGVLGCIVGLGFLTKYAMIFFIVSLYLFLIDTNRSTLQTLGPWLSVGIAVVSFTPNLIWNANRKFITFQHTIENINLQWQELFHPEESLSFIGSIFLIFGPIQTVILFWFAQKYTVTRIQKGIKDANASLLLLFSLPLLVIMGVESILSRIHANWLAPACVSATILTTSWCIHYNRSWLLRITIVIHLVASFMLYNLERITYPLGNLANPLRRLHGWDIAGYEVLCEHLNYQTSSLLFENRKILAPIMYYTRPTALDSVIWSNSNLIHNHFEMTTRLHKVTNQSFLLVTGWSSIARVSYSFIGMRAIGILKVQPGLEREMQILFCDTFQGY